MNMKRMRALFKRELTDILRDKKTLIMMIVVPIILYPLLIVGMTFLMSSIMSSQAEKTYLVAFENDEVLSEHIGNILDKEQEEIIHQQDMLIMLQMILRRL